jgi:hypothetical protein
MTPPDGACPDANIFAALVDGLLDDAERAALDAHLDTCDACQTLAIALGISLSTQDDDAPPDAPGATIGRYRVVRLVGSGGQGIVYEARDETLDRAVAIKLLHPALLDAAQRDSADARIAREARLLATVRHPNVLAIFDVGTWREQLYIVTEFIDGATLDAWIAQHALSWRQIVRCYQDAALGLRAAHQRGVIHRDLKPANILVDSSGRVVLTDFGLATEPATSADPQGSITRQGTILGTPAYMAPEQHLGAPADQRSDLFSLSASLYASLHDQRPFAGDTPHDIARRACAGELSPPPPNDLPPALHDLIRRSLSPDPARRPADLDQWLTQLDAAITVRSPNSWRSYGIAGALLALIGASILVSTTPTTPDITPSPVTAPIHIEEPIQRDAPTPRWSAAEASAAVHDARARAAEMAVTKRPEAPTARRTPRVRPQEAAPVAAHDEQEVMKRLNAAMEAARRHDPKACRAASARMPADHPSSALAQGMCALIEGDCTRGEQTIAAHYAQTMSAALAEQSAAATARGLCRPAERDAVAWIGWSLEPIYQASSAPARCIQESARMRALLESPTTRRILGSDEETQALVRRALDTSIACLRAAPQAPCGLIAGILALRAESPGPRPTLDQLAPRCAAP